MTRGYSVNFGKALIIFFFITIGIFALSTFAIRYENSTWANLIGYAWPLFMPLGWLGPAVVAMIGVAASVRSRRQPLYITYILCFLTSLAWFVIAGLFFALPLRPGDAQGILQAFLNPMLLLWVALLVVVVVGIDRWIHTPKKSLTTESQTPKLKTGNPA